MDLTTKAKIPVYVVFRGYVEDESIIRWDIKVIVVTIKVDGKFTLLSATIIVLSVQKESY